MVKKNLFPSISVLMVLVLFLASCSKKNEYTNVIPADAALVVSFDIKSMVEKSGLTDKSNEPLMQKLFDEVRADMGATAVQLAEKIMRNPEESGLSVTDKVFLFGSSKDMGLVMKVSDESKLRDFFRVLETEKACTSLESGDGFSWVTIDQQVICAFNENVLLLMASSVSAGIESLKADAKMLMTQKEDAGIRQNPGFKKMGDQKEDISIFASFSGVPDMYLAQVSMGLPAGASLKELMILGSINFEKGKIVARAEMFTENKELKKLYEEQIEVMGKSDGEFLAYFPASTLAFLNYNLKGEKLYEMLATNPQFSEAMKNPAMGMDMKKLLSSFDGDISIGLTGLSGFGMPTILAYAKMKGDYLLTTLIAQREMLEMASGAKLSVKGENAYQVNYKGVDIYFGMSDKHLYVTNDVSVLGRLGEKVNDPLADAVWASQAKKSSAFFGMNIAEIMKNPLIMALTSSNDQNMVAATSIFTECSYVQVYEASKGVGEIDIVLKNQDENVLKQLVSGIGKVAGK